ncbi:unnamed protein product, partial [marine sediment metagenome]
MVTGILEIAEQNRIGALAGLDTKSQDKLGQFFTPSRAAVLIASLPRLPQSGTIRVLDPGAGSGSLSAAIVSRVIDERPDLYVHVVAVECDKGVIGYLEDT